MLLFIVLAVVGLVALISGIILYKKGHSLFFSVLVASIGIALLIGLLNGIVMSILLLGKLYF